MYKIDISDWAPYLLDTAVKRVPITDRLASSAVAHPRGGRSQGSPSPRTSINITNMTSTILFHL